MKKWVTVALAAACLTGCGKTVGESSPPKAYGAVDTAWVGCPRFQHAYAWPPFAGLDYRSDMNPMLRKSKTMMGVSLYGASELVIRVERLRGEMTLRAHPLRPEGTASAKGPGWAYAINDSSKWGCASGYLWVDEEVADGTQGQGRGVVHDRVAVQRWFMAPMQDGSLALGRRIIYTGGTSHLFSWGNASAIPYPTPSLEVWQWSHLKRIPMADLDPK